MINLTSQVIAITAELCSLQQTLLAFDHVWPKTLLVHPDVPKAIKYPTFTNSCIPDPQCEGCQFLDEIQFFCRGCQDASAVDISSERLIMIYGAASPNAAPLDLELVAIWPYGTESSVQMITVNFVDPVCDKLPFTDLESPLLRADLGSKKIFSTSIGPFQEPTVSCGNRVFQVFGSCLSQAENGDNTLAISIDTNHSDCQTPGIYQGSLIIKFDLFNNSDSLLNFNYALECHPKMNLVGSDAWDHEYTLGGPDLTINLGTWVPKFDCGSLADSHLRYSEQTDEDWFSFDKISHQLHVFGHPQIFERDHFEFIYEARQEGEVVSSSVVRVNVVKFASQETSPTAAVGVFRKALQRATSKIKTRSQVFVQQEAIQSLASSSHLRKLQSNDFCNYNSFDFYVVLSQTQTQFSYQVVNPSEQVIVCEIKKNSPLQEVTFKSPELSFTYNNLNVLGGYYLIQVQCNCEPFGDDDKYFYLEVIGSCSSTTMNSPYLPDLTIDATYQQTTIPAFGDTFSGTTNPPTCGPRWCYSNANYDPVNNQQNAPNVFWDQNNQEFTVQKTSNDVAGTVYFVQLYCELENYNIVGGFTSFTIMITDDCSSTAMIPPTLPPLTIDSTYVSTTIPAFADTFSGATSPPTCGPRACTSDSPNVIWDASTQVFTVQATPNDVARTTQTVELLCMLPYYPYIPSISQSFAITFTGDCSSTTMIPPTLPPLTIDSTYVPTTIPAFGDTFSGTTNPPACGPRVCTSDSPNVIWDASTQLFTVKSLTTDVAGTQTVSLTCSLLNYAVVPQNTVQFGLTISGCTLTSINTVPLIAGSISKNIFSAATPYAISTYTQTPACGLNPSYQVGANQQLPTLGTPQVSPSFWVLDAVNNKVNLQSNDPTLAGTTYQVRLKVDIGSLTDTQSLAVSWVNPCSSTNFVAQPMANSIGFISDPALTVKVPVPKLNDLANISYGTSTISSICSSQSFLATENGKTPQFITTSVDAGQNVINFATTNSAMAGPHIITVTTSLDLYPAVVDTSTFTFTFYQLLVPRPPPTTTYQVLSPALVIPVGSIQVNPSNPAIVINNSASLQGGAALPAFIVFSESSSNSGLKFTVSTANNSAVGTYQILITSTFLLAPQPSVTQTQTFTLHVIAAAAKVSLNSAPSIISGYEPEVSMLWNTSKVIVYDIKDKETDPVRVNVDFGSHGIYCTYTSSDTKITITCGPLLSQPPSQFSESFTITLKDNITPAVGVTLPQNQYNVLLKIITDSDEVKTSNQPAAAAPTSVAFAGTTIPVQERKKQEVVIETLPLIRPQIKFISNMALVNVTFDKEISPNITQQQIKVRYTQNSNEADQTKTFTWNITEVNATYMLLQLNFTNPILVSQGHIPDLLEVSYRNDYLYPLGKRAPFVDLNFTADLQIMPKLAPSKEAAKTINSISSLTAEVAQSSFWVFLAIYLVISTAMKYVWATFNTLQIILVLPMLMVNVPVNVMNVQDSFKKIVNLDFIDKNKVYKVICEPLFGEIIETVNYPDKEVSAEMLAERSKSLVIQITIMAVLCVVLAATMIGFVVLRIFIRRVKNKTVLNVYKSLESKVMYSSVLRYAIQQYMAFSLTTLIAINKIVNQATPTVSERLLEATDAEAPQLDIKQIVITTLLTLFLIFYPAFCYWFINRYAIILYMNVMKMRFGTLYVGLNYYKKSSHVYLTIFLVRRLLFAVIVVYVTQNVELQLILSMYCSMMMLYYLMAYMPMWDLALNIIFLFNEYCLFLCTCLMFLFTDYVPLPENRFTLGWFYLAVLGLNVLGNGVYVARDIVVQIKLKLYYKKVIKELRAQRETKKLQEIELKKVEKKKVEDEKRKEENSKVDLEKQERSKVEEKKKAILDGEQMKVEAIKTQILNLQKKKVEETKQKVMEEQNRRNRQQKFEREIHNDFSDDYISSIADSQHSSQKLVEKEAQKIESRQTSLVERLERNLERDLVEYKKYIRSLNKNTVTIAQNDSKLLQTMVDQEWDNVYIKEEKILKANKVQNQEMTMSQKLEINERQMEMKMQKQILRRKKIVEDNNEPSAIFKQPYKREWF